MRRLRDGRAPHWDSSAFGVWFQTSALSNHHGPASSFGVGLRGSRSPDAAASQQCLPGGPGTRPCRFAGIGCKEQPRPICRAPQQSDCASERPCEAELEAAPPRQHRIDHRMHRCPPSRSRRWISSIHQPRVVGRRVGAHAARTQIKTAGSSLRLTIEVPSRTPRPAHLVEGHGRVGAVRHGCWSPGPQQQHAAR